MFQSVSECDWQKQKQKIKNKTSNMHGNIIQISMDIFNVKYNEY